MDIYTVNTVKQGRYYLFNPEKVKGNVEFNQNQKSNREYHEIDMSTIFKNIWVPYLTDKPIILILKLNYYKT